VGTSSDEARLAAEMALWQWVTGQGSPLPHAHAAMEHDAQWLLPHLLQAGDHLMSHAGVNEVAAKEVLAACAPLVEHAPPREQAHAKALHLLAEGRSSAACQVWDALLLDHPCDMLALLWAQRAELLRGDTLQLAQRPARVLPEWDEDDPLYAQVLGLWAFGLQEAGAFAHAEDVARRALAHHPQEQRVMTALHTVAHVMHVQGRFDEGAAWLHRHQPLWSASPHGPSLQSQADSAHLWAHTALFRIEGMDLKGALRIADAHLGASRITSARAMADASTVLWRLQLLGVDVRERAQQVEQAWVCHHTSPAGGHVYNDVHHLLLRLVAGDVAGAEHLVAQSAARVMAGADAKRDNHAVAREVGLPISRAFVAYARGQVDAAATALYGLRHAAQRFGGTTVEREVIDLTVLAAGGPAARAVANEHALTRPCTPLAQHWRERLAKH
jgi:hypothetical protein